MFLEFLQAIFAATVVGVIVELFRRALVPAVVERDE